MRFFCASKEDRRPSLNTFVLPFGDSPCGKCHQAVYAPKTHLEILQDRKKRVGAHPNHQQKSNSTPTTPVTGAKNQQLSNGRTNLPAAESVVVSTSTARPLQAPPQQQQVHQQLHQQVQHQQPNHLPPPYAGTLGNSSQRTTPLPMSIANNAQEAHNQHLHQRSGGSGDESPYQQRNFDHQLIHQRQQSPSLGPHNQAQLIPRLTNKFEDPLVGDVVPPRPPRQLSAAQRSSSAGVGSPGARPQLHSLYSPPKENRANLILQQLRADDGAQSESDVSEPAYHRLPLPPQRNSSSMLNSKGVVYLEFNKEVKRSNLPARLYTFEQIKSLFLRSFPNLTLQFLNQDHVKIYISDRNSNGENVLFYELEDLHDIRDQAVLKIHQSQGFRSPAPPLRFTDHPPTDYISEPEMLDDRHQARFAHTYRNRPSSAVPGEMGRTYPQGSGYGSSSSNGGGGKSGIMAKRGENALTSSHFEPYYDPYYSDASSHGPRSGSVTPVIDKETRFRVENMEKQLAGLSTLVRSALLNKESAPQQDMLDLGRRLLEMRTDAERFAQSMTSSSLISDSESVLLVNGKQLTQVRRGVRETQSGLNELRDFLQIDGQAKRDMLRDVMSKVSARVEAFLKENRKNSAAVALPGTQPNKLNTDKTRHQKALTALEEGIQRLEDRIEERRINVLSRNHKLRMFEVDELTEHLSEIDQKAADLKAYYAKLESDVARDVDFHKDEIARDNEFLRREPLNLENCGRRCAALTNMLATMKKLALVQDPAMYDRSKGVLNLEQVQGPPALRLQHRSNGVLHNTNTASTSDGPKHELLPPLPASAQRVSSPNPIRSVIAVGTMPSPSNTQPNGSLNSTHGPTNHQLPPPQPTPSTQAMGTNVLDSILDELNNTANSLPSSPGILPSIPSDSTQHSPPGQIGSNKRFAEASATLTLKEPPKIPERISSADPRRRFLTSKTIPLKSNGQLNHQSYGQPPVPAQKTSALDSDTNSFTPKTSSNESINSQEGARYVGNSQVHNLFEDQEKYLDQQLRKLQGLAQ